MSLYALKNHSERAKEQRKIYATGVTFLSLQFLVYFELRLIMVFIIGRCDGQCPLMCMLDLRVNPIGERLLTERPNLYRP